MKKFLCTLLALVCVLSLAACGAGKTESNGKKFTMGIDPEYPPFSSLGDDGKYTGFDVEVCQAVCEKLGWEFAVFEVNWDEKLEYSHLEKYENQSLIQTNVTVYGPV